MFYLSIGAYYGANVTVAAFIANVLSVALGNIVGGAIIVGGSEFYM